MKRSAELTPLSHDHHQALAVALQLKRATPEDGAIAGRAFLDHDERIGALHFRIEEEILLPAWLAATEGGEEAASMAARVAAEHLEIRAAARRLRSGPATPDELQDLGALLERHVRFEERELFPLIERSLDEDAIRAVGAEIEAAETASSP
jgi:hemerythrin-like domain-containing protein